MRNTPRKWPSGTGQWQRTRTIVMAPTGADDTEDAVVVTTPLDLITRLEDDRELIGMVVLSSAFASLEAAIRELYPKVGVIAKAS